MRDVPEATPLLAVENLMKNFPVRGGIFGRAVAQVHAVDGVVPSDHYGVFAELRY